MDTKLTLKLDKKTIEKAKLYARKNNLSLSQIVEMYFKYIVNEKDFENYTPLIKELSGIIEMGNSADYKDDYTDYLIKKYK